MSIEIKSAADLNETLEDLKRENEMTAGQLQALKTAWKTGYSSGGQKTGWADGDRFLKALVTGKTDVMQELGSAPFRGDSVEKISKGQKVDLGTPLYSYTTTGSYTVPTEFHNEVIRAMGEHSVLLSMVRHLPMNSYTLQVPTKATAPTLTWVTDQTTALTESNPTFDRKTLTAYSLAAWVALHESFIEDQAVGVFDYFRSEFAADLADEMDNQILNGSGTPWEGILYSGDVNEVVMGTGNTGFTDVDYDDLMDLIDAVTYKKYQKGGSFVCHPSVMTTLRRLTDANGNPYIVDATAADPPRIAGYPIHTADAAPSTSAASTSFIAFGNFKFFLLGDRVPLSVKVFDQTDYAVQYEEIFIRARARFGGVIGIPGAFAKLTTSAT